ncbi:MAG TPA: chemotaxis protein CheA, partial [Polyangiaceae bacterium]|nr:chemotaxis protein CheA [Polyangiaceae bacterium]
LRLELEPADADLINEVFRAAHTIKGSAGLFAFDAIVHFAHHVESVLDRVRDGSLGINAEITALLLASCDHIGTLVRAATGAETASDATPNQGAALIARLEPLLSPQAAEVAASMRPRTDGIAARADASPTAPAACEPAPSGADEWSLHLRFGRDVLRHGMDPLSFLRYLARLGEIRWLYTRADALPPAPEVDPECCYLSFELTFRGTATQSELDSVFEFVREDSEIVIRRRQPTLPPPTLTPTPTPVRPPGSRRARSTEPAVAPSEGGAALEAASAPSAGAAPSRATPSKPDAGEPSREPKPREGRLIRVDAEKLDQLIDLVGELVIAGAGSRLHAERSGQSVLVESATSVSRLVEEVRNAALGLRMVAIGATFQRFHRVVRDVSHELGKDIELVVDGAETELDKSLVEKLGDPLLHLVRNAIDHGIESVEARRQAGKGERGRIRLNAYHDSGSVVVEVSDDGRGLHRERILEKAIAVGLVQPDQTLSDREVFELIFEAGFSTADQVSNLSGRGVGMDVVRSGIEALRGMVELTTEPGRGTTVRIRLPLTLAIIDGFLVKSGGVHYVIPLEMVVECLGFSAADRRSAQERGFIGVRGQVLPLVRLSEAFGLPGGSSQREDVVVVKSGSQTAGLVVDQLLGELQTVIKPLGKLFASVRGISGSALLGSGEVALILDVNALVHNLARRVEKATRRTNGSAHAAEQAEAFGAASARSPTTERTRHGVVS